MSDQPFSIDDLDDNVFGSDFADDTDATTPSKTQADEEPAEDEQPEVDIPAVAKAPTDAGPGDLKVALKQEREQRQALQQQFNTLQAQITQQQEREQQARYQEQLRQDVAMLDPDDVPAYLHAKEQERLTHLQAQAQQQQAEQALTLSEQYARAAFPDYDQQIAKVLGAFGPAVAQWALTQPNPAMAVYEKAKTLFTEQDFEKAVEERTQARLAEIANRSNPHRKSPPPAPRLGGLPAAAKPSSTSDPLKGVKRGLASQVGGEEWHRSVDKLFEMTAE